MYRRNTCTKVHDIVLQLMGEDEVLSKEISGKVNHKLDEGFGSDNQSVDRTFESGFDLNAELGFNYYY